MGDPARHDAMFAATGLRKRFGATQALDGLSIDVHRGEIHGLVGANGSGKTTFVQILAGLVRADAAETLMFDGRRLTVDELAAASPARVRLVHQDPCTFDDLSVAENLALGSGYPLSRSTRIAWRRLYRRSSEILERFEIPVAPRASMSSLSMADQTMVAIARVLQDQRDQRERATSVLVLDEPTAALPDRDVEDLLDALRRFASRGQTILLIDHRLREVLAVADRVTVLRDGRRVACRAASGLSEDSLADLVAGGAARPVAASRSGPPPGSTAGVTVEALTGPGVREVSLSVRRGEIVGLTGLRGAGHSELLRGLFGVTPMTRGTVRVAGAELRLGSPGRAMKAGIAYVPSDRARDAALTGMDVAANISAAVHGRYWRRWRIDSRAERRDAAALCARFLVNAASIDAPLNTLSGGNQQKVVFARWLRREPTLLLLDEPTQGVDVGARREIERFIRHAAHGGGTSVLLASSDVDELAGLCDRILIMAHGRLVDELHGPVARGEITNLVTAKAAGR
ncbi:sugar ABC transporter ATP-binding protein [Pseudonocardia acaciae]|uniref:sugar ABC transporter ATP-binding protein n=1 Tax=Pseudonocardia acaciae TaxID=551276 RepID=UPI000687FE25|nr:sugar ABC transporter ATP-binding protein [Pseudonocardia acaciae]